MKSEYLNSEWQVVDQPQSESEIIYRVAANVLFALLIIACCWCVALNDENKNLKTNTTIIR